MDDFNTLENSLGLKTSKLKFKKSDQAKRLNIYPKGTLVFPKRGAAIFKNRVQILLENATVDPNLMCLDAFGINALYLREYMLFIGLHNFSDNSGVPQINNKHLYPLLFPVPSKAEQEKIIDAFSSIDQSIQSSINTLFSLIAKKSALMSDLLTGRVRVNVDAKDANKIEEAA